MPGTHGYVWSHSRRGFQLQMEFIKVAAQLTLRQGCILDHAGAQNEVEGTLEERMRQDAQSNVAEMEEGGRDQQDTSRNR